MPRTTLTKQRNATKQTTEYAPDSSFYATWQWRKFRAKHKAKQIKADYKRGREAVLDTDTEASGIDYTAWLMSKAPLCEAALKQGRIEAAAVLDHITPIRMGGAKYDSANLQWLSHEAHNKKRGTEGVRQ